jgi:hypothetical protein
LLHDTRGQFEAECERMLLDASFDEGL